MSFETVPGTDIRILNPVDLGGFKQALFDFDGTVSLMREGWQQIMVPLMVELITGDHPSTPEIDDEVDQYIADSTGINTILQMEHLVEMVREKGLVAADRIQDAHAYKAIYNDRLMERVSKRIAALERGDLPLEEATVRGAIDFLKALHGRGLTMYVFSGTDQPDVKHEAALVGAAPYFAEIHGALRTYAESNKEKVLRRIIEDHDLHGSEVLVVGDGPVEIRHGKQFGCVTIGVATDELGGEGWDEAKVDRLAKAGADILIPHFAEGPALIEYLFTTA